MRRALPLVSFLALLLLQVAPAGAHAYYESSNPADGSTVGSPPSQVQADFSEPVTSDSYMEVTDPCGDVVSGGSSPVADKISVAMSGTRAGTYSVFFSVQSSVDSHVTEGSFTFTSSGGDACPGAEPPPGGGGGGDDPPPGGGGGGDDPPPGGGGGSDGPSDQPADTSGDSNEGVDTNPASPGGGSDHAAGHGGSRSHGGRAGKNRAASGGSRNLEVASGERERREPDPWDLPAGGLVAGLSIAALIGAAGGRIYAGIMGPRH